MRLTGVNWFGFETEYFVVKGLEKRHHKAILDDVVGKLGFNTLRLPFSAEAIRPGASVAAGVLTANPEFNGMTPLQIMDEIIDYCGVIGLSVFLDRHSSVHNGLTKEPIWYIPGHSYYTEDQWVADWVSIV